MNDLRAEIRAQEHKLRQLRVNFITRTLEQELSLISPITALSFHTAPGNETGLPMPIAMTLEEGGRMHRYDENGKDGTDDLDFLQALPCWDDLLAILENECGENGDPLILIPGPAVDR